MYFFVIFRFKTRCVNKTSAPHKIRVTKGAVHVAVSRGFVEYAIYDQRARDILIWMNKSCHIPDEAFFTTLNHNPHLGVPGAYKGLFILFEISVSISRVDKIY